MALGKVLDEGFATLRDILEQQPIGYQPGCTNCPLPERQELYDVYEGLPHGEEGSKPPVPLLERLLSWVRSLI